MMTALKSTVINSRWTRVNKVFNVLNAITGAVLGTAVMIDGLMARFRAELGQDTAAIATGQFPKSILNACTCGITYRENLILDGLYMIWCKNKKK